MDSLIKQFKQTSQLAGGNAAFIEDLYEQYLVDPASVAPAWKAYFDGFKGREIVGRDLDGVAVPDSDGGHRSIFGDLDGIVIEEPEQGCTGGTGFALSVSDGGFALEGSACGGANSNAEERVAAWIRPVRSLFPPMDQLAPEGAG